MLCKLKLRGQEIGLRLGTQRRHRALNTPTPRALQPIVNLSKSEKHMKNLIVRFVRNEEGQDLVEYAMLLAFIALIAIGGVQVLGTTVNEFFDNVATKLGS